MSVVFFVLKNKPNPIMLPQGKLLLQLIVDTRVGVWFLFEDHTKIRLDGAEVEPYHLPLFLSMRIFSLNFIRESLNLDQIHFFPRYKGYIFKLENIVQPFIINTKQYLG